MAHARQVFNTMLANRGNTQPPLGHPYHFYHYHLSLLLRPIIIIVVHLHNEHQKKK